jgi:class 3 adenylate cyclase
VYDAVNRFADWRFDGEIPIERRDESGVLALTLNRLAQFYRQIAPFSRKTFAGRIQTGTMPPVNQNNQVVVLFCNIRSFSSVTRDLRPREKLDTADTFFQRAGLCARLTGGHVDKYLGDKMIVYWGIFSGAGLRNNALAAIRAVLMMRAYLGDWNQKRIAAGLAPLLFSFGLDAGRASLAPLSVDGTLEYSLTGPTVNNACRYEAATKGTRTETLLSENIYRLVERFVVAGEIPHTPAKPLNRIFALINIREKKLTRLMLKDLARIADIDLPFAMTLAGPRGPKTLSELRMALHSGHS